MSTTELAQPKKPTLLQVIGGDEFKKQLAMALPKHLTPDRFARIAITAMRKTPKLMQCTPESVYNCLLQLSQYGIEADGRRAHLIPYGTECTLILDYKGLAELALRSGLVSTLHADVVHRGDVFEYSLGKVSKHTPWFLRCDRDKPEKEGDVFAVYAICENKDGTSCCSVLSYEEVEAVRRRSKSGNNGPWKTDWAEMAKKTAFRRLSKWLVLSPEFREAVVHDEETDILETTAVSQTVKIADLLGESMDAEQHEEQTYSATQTLKDCVEFMDNLVQDRKAKFVDSDDGIHTFELTNGKFVSFGDNSTDDESVDTTLPDCLTIVKKIVERALKK